MLKLSVDVFHHGTYDAEDGLESVDVVDDNPRVGLYNSVLERDLMYIDSRSFEQHKYHS